MNSPIRVAIIEDHPEFREMVEMILEDESEIELEWQFGSAERALRQMQSSLGKCAPDVVILDLGLPGIDGHKALSELRVIAPQAKVIILSQSGAEADVVRAISCGAVGYLLKSAKAEQIVTAIKEVTEGGNPLDAKVARYLLNNLPSLLPSETKQNSLTDRELEVLELVAQGLVKKEIAARLGVSPTTIISHVNRIYEKLETPNAPAAVAKAYQRGLLPRKGD